MMQDYNDTASLKYTTLWKYLWLMLIAKLSTCTLYHHHTNKKYNQIMYIVFIWFYKIIPITHTSLHQDILNIVHGSYQNKHTNWVITFLKIPESSLHKPPKHIPSTINP